MTVITFPSIIPSNYTFSPAVYPTSSPKFRSASTNPRLWASKPSTSELDLIFNNLTDSNILTVMTQWEDSLSGTFEVLLPSTVISAIVSSTFRLRIQNNTWYFKNAPKFSKTSIVSNVVTVGLTTLRPSA